MDVETLNVALLAGAAVLLAAVGAVRVAVRLGLPSLLGYLALGVLVGEDVLGFDFDDAQLAQTLGYAALVIILAEGGLTSRWPLLRPVMPLAVVLSTIGVAASIAVTAVAAHLLLDWSWRLALILGAVLASTDAAAVFATLRRLPLPPRLVGILEAESGLNDAPIVLIVTLLSTGADQDSSPLAVIALIGYELAAGAVIGLAAGGAGVWVLRRSALPASGLYPLSVLGFAVLGYAAAAELHASGFLAVYVAGLTLGTADLPHRPATRSFAEGLGWLAQIGLFVMLGLLVTPSQLGGVLLPALGIGLAHLLLARPASVLVSATPFRVPWRQQAFLSWAGLRGAVPIVLATIPVTEGIIGSRRLFDLVFVLVVIFTLLQGPTLSPAARRLGLARPTEARDVEVESAPLEELHADLLQLRVPPLSRLHGVEIAELRLPPGAQVTLVVRGASSFVPDPATRLRRGDALLIVATSSSRPAAERRLRAVSRRGKLAGWAGEGGEPG